MISMRLSRKYDKILLFSTVFAVSAVFGVMLARNFYSKTYAESETGVYVEAEEHFVTFYDEGEKLIVKTDAPTVREALERANIVLNATDLVDPALDTAIDANNFYINIHRSRPAVIKDGSQTKYLMTASYDNATIAKEAGLTLYDGDEIVEIENTNFLEIGYASVYQVTRNGGRSLTVDTEIEFTTREIKDYNLAPGTREVRELGELGLKRALYEVFYIDNEEASRTLISEEIVREPVEKVVAVGAEPVSQNPLTVSMGRNRYTVTKADGTVVERQETYYDLNMAVVATFCGNSGYRVREDGAKVDAEGYVMVAAELSRYPRCSVVETSLGPGKVYDTGGFALTNPEQFDLATDWSDRNGI